MIHLTLKLEVEEREQLKKDAHRHEMNVSEYLRWLIQKQRDEDYA